MDTALRIVSRMEVHDWRRHQEPADPVYRRGAVPSSP